VKTIEEYVIDLVADGAESKIEDDLNEDGEIADDDHEAACDLAMAIVRAIRDNPDALVALTVASEETTEPGAGQ
jgi:hypothetical protein